MVRIQGKINSKYNKEVQDRYVLRFENDETNRVKLKRISVKSESKKNLVIDINKFFFENLVLASCKRCFWCWLGMTGP
jgi:hypothetical protein